MNYFKSYGLIILIVICVNCKPKRSFDSKNKATNQSQTDITTNNSIEMTNEIKSIIIDDIPITSDLNDQKTIIRTGLEFSSVLSNVLNIFESEIYDSLILLKDSMAQNSYFDRNNMHASSLAAYTKIASHACRIYLNKDDAKKLTPDEMIDNISDRIFFNEKLKNDVVNEIKKFRNLNLKTSKKEIIKQTICTLLVSNLILF